MRLPLKRRAENLGVRPGELRLIDGYFSMRRRLYEGALSEARKSAPSVLRGLLKCSSQSLRQMARLMEFSPSYLSLIMAGKTLASPDFIERLSEMTRAFGDRIADARN